MEIRVLNYFLAVAREQNFSRAADALHLTQPTLSRQLADLESELGKPLFNRGRKVTLTEDGVLFRKRAEEIINLVSKTQTEIVNSNKDISGEIHIGTGESDTLSIIADICRLLHKDFPGIHYNFISDDSSDVEELLAKGLIDFGILFGGIDKSKYNYIDLPIKDTWGVLMKDNSEISNLKQITPKDLYNKPIIFPRQDNNKIIFKDWFKNYFNSLNIIATYNLVFNASVLVKKDLGYALTLDKLINTSGNSGLKFIPLSPKMEIELHLVWKKYQIFSKASEKFLEYVKNSLG